ncbi:hypothetical protein D3227_37930 [Mesorhizobium waimense]|uniref:Uncharacterized protein n=1 Tax=Mesorhizobium waimense TaxID=1300307 RepID=A0A3A5JUT1_9HYPH|nr:hypothetical protein [Mesorhizobium waimense]RJT24063.1 hypothetical protein D3227_37930 [Mesorhizobium waimense]
MNIIDIVTSLLSSVPRPRAGRPLPLALREGSSPKAETAKPARGAADAATKARPAAGRRARIGWAAERRTAEDQPATEMAAIADELSDQEAGDRIWWSPGADRAP